MKMNANPFQQSAYAGDVTGLMASTPQKRTIWQRILGIRVTPPDNDQESCHDSVEHALSDSNFGHDANDGLDAMLSGSKSSVFVSKPVRNPLEAFKDAITDGTRLFCEQNVHPLYVEDSQTKFRVSGIKMYIPRSKNDLMAVIEQLPIDVRNRLARLRAQSAPGAAEQLVFDEDFFGITIDIEPTVIDGQYVSLIASWAGTNVDIKMVFTGQYVTIKHLVETKPVEVQTKAITASVNIAPDLTGAVNLNLTDPELNGSKSLMDKTSDVPLEMLSASCGNREAVTAIDSAAVRRISHDTPLNLPQRVKQGKDTYIPALGRHPVARLRLLPHGAEKETVVDICTDMLPFVIGRDYTASGNFERGLNLGADGDDPSVILVSREHLELRRFDRNENHFQVVNHAIKSNGSYHNGCPLPERFIFKASGRQNAMVLGGASGPGTVLVVFEAV